MTRLLAVRPRVPVRQPRPLVWFFDLDDTLHDASHSIFGAIDARMTDFVQRHLNVDRPQADALRRAYWQRYGATLLGLIRHHQVDPHRFLRETHDFDIAALLRAERGLAHLGRRLAGRKVLLTNAPDDYAGQVLRGIGLHRHISAREIRPRRSSSSCEAGMARSDLILTNGTTLVV